MGLIAGPVSLLLLGGGAWGLVLVYRGLRGVASLTSPACATCGYDLRGFVGDPPTTCSECGADLTRPGSIRLARLQRQPGRAVVGLALVAIALASWIGLRFVAVAQVVTFAAPMGSPQAIATQTNGQIIAGLATTANTPWGWQELERRWAAGALPPADVKAAVDQYIAYRSTAGPNAKAGPLSWADSFMKQADQRNLIPPAQFDRLADAFFGPVPVVTMAPHLSSSRTPVKVEYGGPWDLLGWQPIYALRSVTLEDGTAVSVQPSGYGGRQKKVDTKQLSSSGSFGIDATLAVDAKPGPHTLTFTVDTGLIDQDTRQLINNTGRPGQADLWPTNVVRKTRTATVVVTVLASPADTLERVTDTTRAGWPPFALKRITALPADGGTAVTVELTEAARGDVDSAYDVSMTFAGRKQTVGTEDRSSTVGAWSSSTIQVRPAIPPEVTTVTVTMTPNPSRAARTPGVTRAWDVPIEFKDVPLRRLDRTTP
jgi:hypothetical protein